MKSLDFLHICDPHWIMIILLINSVANVYGKYCLSLFDYITLTLTLFFPLFFFLTLFNSVQLNSVALYSTTIEPNKSMSEKRNWAKSFKLYPWGLPIHTQFDDYEHVSRLQVCFKHKLK